MNKESKLFAIRGILSMFLAFFIIVVGVNLAPTVSGQTGPEGLFVYCLSIMFSAVFIILNGLGFFDKLKWTQIKKRNLQ